jgi:hypothetical protein
MLWKGSKKSPKKYKLNEVSVVFSRDGRVVVLWMEAKIKQGVSSVVMGWEGWDSYGARKGVKNISEEVKQCRYTWWEGCECDAGMEWICLIQESCD